MNESNNELKLEYTDNNTTAPPYVDHIELGDLYNYYQVDVERVYSSFVIIKCLKTKDFISQSGYIQRIIVNKAVDITLNDKFDWEKSLTIDICKIKNITDREASYYESYVVE